MTPLKIIEKGRPCYSFLIPWIRISRFRQFIFLFTAAQMNIRFCLRSGNGHWDAEDAQRRQAQPEMQVKGIIKTNLPVKL